MTTQYIIKKHCGETYYFADEGMTILHREDGPAVIRSWGSKFWWINDKELTEAEFNALTKPEPEKPLDEKSAHLLTLISAANAVVERWETPAWKEAMPTATFIHALRDAADRMKGVKL
jgi:hypothetical protein